MKKSKIALIFAATMFAGSALAASSNNKASVEQTGNGNSAAVTQVGDSNANEAFITQAGDSNAAQVTQEVGQGGNRATVSQSGNRDDVELSQKGATNIAVVLQASSSHSNSVTVNQAGSANYAGVATELGGNSKITIEQDGHRNKVANSRIAVNYFGADIGAGTYGANNTLNISQVGNDNSAYGDSANNHSTVDIVQIGDFNQAAVESWSLDDNDLDVKQFGKSHFADVYVEGGSSNRVVVNQGHSLNRATVTTYGAKNTAIVNQGHLPAAE